MHETAGMIDSTSFNINQLLGIVEIVPNSYLDSVVT